MEDYIKVFSDGIKTKYRDGLMGRESRWPLCRENPCDESMKLKLCYSMDNILVPDQKGKATKEVSVNYADLFKIDPQAKSQKKIRKILVEGDAGTGKTTFCNAVSKEWADKKILLQFNLLLFLPLRQKAIASATSLFDILKLLHSSEKVRSSVAAHLKENEGESTLIIADGWDELSDSERQEASFLYKLLFGEHLPLVSVLLTSRPYASAPLRNLQFIDRCIKIRGFDKENIEECILSQCPTKEMASCVIEQLTSNPLLESICSVPLNCAILCYIQQIEACTPSWTSTTTTQLYNNITLNVIKRNIKKLEPNKRLLFSNFDSLPENLQQSWWLQCEFAYRALVENQLNFTDESKLPENAEAMFSFGLMQSTESSLVSGPGVSFHFLHSTFQEFLAALHLERQPPDKKVEFCRRHSNSENFALVWRFFFGICHSKGNKYENEREKRAIKLIIKSLRHDALTQCHCVFEAQSQVIINDEVIYDAEKLDPCTAYDCMAIAYVIANSQHTAPLEINFSNCSLNDNVVTSIANTLANASNLHVKQLLLDENRLSGNGIYHLFNNASSIFRSLKLLNLSQNPLGVSGFMKLELIVSDGILRNLRWLYLQGSLDHELVEGVHENHLSVSFWKALSKHCPKLNIVNLVESDHLENFDLEGVPLGLEGTLCIGNILSNDITDSDYDYSGCIDLSSCQLTATELPNSEVVNLSLCRASEELLNLSENTSILSLHLDKNNFNSDKIGILAGFMKLCPCLSFLYTRNCNINSVGIKNILSQHLLLTKLDRWALDNNQIEDDGVEAFLHYQHSLRVDDEGITFSGNPLTSEKFEWLRNQNGKHLSQIDTFADEQCEVDTSVNDEEADTTRDTNEGEEIEYSDEEQSPPSNDSNYIPSEGSETEEESDYSEDSSSDSDNGNIIEDDPLSSQDVGDKVSELESDNDELSSQDTQNSMESEDESYDPNEDSDDDEGSSNDENEDQSPSSKKMKLTITKRLLPSDLALVRRAAWEVRPKWYDLGLELGITSDSLDSIKEDYQTTETRFREMLKVWLKSHHTTKSWSALADALRAPPVGHTDLADQLPQE